MYSSDVTDFPFTRGGGGKTLKEKSLPTDGKAILLREKEVDLSLDDSEVTETGALTCILSLLDKGLVDPGENNRKAAMLLSSSVCCRRRLSIEETLPPPRPARRFPALRTMSFIP
jgi:hypothetical protein